MNLESLFIEKVVLLEGFLEKTKNYRARFNEDVDIEIKLDWVDELSDLREESLKVMQVLDREIEVTKLTLNRETIEKLQGDRVFQGLLEKNFKINS